MKNSLNTNIKIPEDQRQKAEVKKDPQTASITGIIGQGDEAKNSFVYLVLRWGFISGCVITLIVAANHWCFRVDEKIPDFSADIKLVWDIIVPILTLALGYAFGRSKD